MPARLSRRRREQLASEAALAIPAGQEVEVLGLPDSLTHRSGRDHHCRAHHRWRAWERLVNPLLADDPLPVAIVRPDDGDVEAEAAFRAAKVAVLRRRHELRRKLWREGDAHRTIDVAEGLHRLATEMVNLGPARKKRADWTYSWLISGVYRYRTNSGHPTSRWRAYPWVVDATKPRGTRGRKGERGKRRVHLGYFDTREEAVAAVLRWRASQGVEIPAAMPEWMAELMRLAVRQTTAVSLA